MKTIMKKIKLFAGAMSLLLFVNCENNQKEKEEITKKIDALYANQISFYEMETDSTLFSKELIDNMYDIKNITIIDKANIENSKQPTDKPFMLEGNIFTEFADGYTKYKIESITINNNKAEAKIAFELDSEPKLNWTDIVFLENIKGWKIVNIRFSDKDDSDNLLSRLTFNRTTSAEDVIIKQTVTGTNGKKMDLIFNDSKFKLDIYYEGENIELKQLIPANGIWYQNNQYEYREKNNKFYLYKNEKIVLSNDDEVSNNEEKSNDNKVSSEEKFSFEYIEAKNYFVRNDYKEQDFHSVKITSQKSLEKIFGMATKMGDNGKPTTIDFSKNYVIALIDKSSDTPIDIEVKSTHTYKNELIIGIIKTKKPQQSYTSRNAKLLIIDNKHQGNIVLEDVK